MFVLLGFTDTLVPGCVCFNISFDVLISPGLGLKVVFFGGGLFWVLAPAPVLLSP